MKRVCKFLAIAVITAVVGLQSSFAQNEDMAAAFYFKELGDFEKVELALFRSNLFEKSAENTALSTMNHSVEVAVHGNASRKTNFLELEISSKIDQLVSDFGLEKVQGLELELMIDIKGKIAKLEMVDTKLDPILVKELLHEIEQWTFKFKKGENTRFILNVG